jgi:hypothetical protein
MTKNSVLYSRMGRTVSVSVFPNPCGDRRAAIPPTGYESLLGGPHALSLLPNELRRRIRRLVYAVEISTSR